MIPRRLASWKAATACLGSAAFLLPACSSAPANPWREVHAPSAGPAAAIGHYSKGCLQGGQALDPDGPGYQVMRVSKGRYYGHPTLIRFLKSYARQASARNLGTVLIGDVALPRGGPTWAGEISHQNGLDADIWFWQPEHGGKLGMDERENLEAENMLTPDRKAVDRDHWSAGKIQLLKLAAENPEVERVFVHPVIKKAVCADPKNRSWHRKLRAYWERGDHFHIRLRCPPGDAQCKPQGPIHDRGACDVSFEVEWFSPEARQQASLVQDQPPSEDMPELPAACRAVLEGP